MTYICSNSLRFILFLNNANFCVKNIVVDVKLETIFVNNNTDYQTIPTNKGCSINKL